MFLFSGGGVEGMQPNAYVVRLYYLFGRPDASPEEMGGLILF